MQSPLYFLTLHLRHRLFIIHFMLTSWPRQIAQFAVEFTVSISYNSTVHSTKDRLHGWLTIVFFWGFGVHGKVCWLIAYSRYFNSGVTVYRVQLSGDNCPPTIAHRQLPTDNCPPTIAHRQLPTDNCPPTIAHRQLPTDNCPPTIAHRQLPTDNCPPDNCPLTIAYR